MTVKEFEKKHNAKMDIENLTCYKIGADFNDDEESMQYYLDTWFSFSNDLGDLHIDSFIDLSIEEYRDILSLWEGLRNEHKRI